MSLRITRMALSAIRAKRSSPAEKEQSQQFVETAQPRSRKSVSPMRAFVFLAHGFGATRWSERWTRGDIPGLTEKLPYGYYRAASLVCDVRHSEDVAELLITKFARLSLRRILGFDLIHAWRNRNDLSSADIVWTHTELEYLAVLALWRCQRRKHRPRLIAHSVWLFDKWPDFSSLRRWLYRRLMNRADCLTVLSPASLKIAAELFPNIHTELVMFGANLDSLTPVVNRKASNPVRIVALGNDMHRDWSTLIAATRQWSECEVRIACRRFDRHMIRNISNIHVVSTTSREEITELYSWADIVVVPLKHNLHVSGITVICEAVLRGVSVVCTDTGGLRAYFSEREVRYVPINEVAAMRRALEELAHDDDARFAMARRAQAHMLSTDLSSRSFAMRHYEISKQLLSAAVLHSDDMLIGEIAPN